MSLTDRVRRLSKPLALIAALAAAPIYSCGGTEDDPAMGCVDNSDCRSGRVCIDGMCEYEGGGVEGENPCLDYCYQFHSCDLMFFERKYRRGLEECEDECHELIINNLQCFIVNDCSRWLNHMDEYKRPEPENPCYTSTQEARSCMFN
jgi:hypothetical protein